MSKGKQLIKDFVDEVKRRKEEEIAEAYVDDVICPQCRKEPAIAEIVISGKKATITIRCSCGYRKDLTEVKKDFSKRDWRNFTNGVEEILQREFLLQDQEINHFWRRCLIDALSGA